MVSALPVVKLLEVRLLSIKGLQSTLKLPNISFTRIVISTMRK